MTTLLWSGDRWLMQGLLTSLLTGVGFLVISFTIEYVKRFRKGKRAKEQEIFLQRILCGEQLLEWSNGKVRARRRREWPSGRSRSLPRGQQLFEQYKQAGNFLGVGQGYYNSLAEARRRAAADLQDRSVTVDVSRRSWCGGPDSRVVPVTSLSSVDVPSLEWDGVLPGYLSPTHASEASQKTGNNDNCAASVWQSCKKAASGIRLWSKQSDNDGDRAGSEIDPDLGVEICARALREHPHLAPFLKQDVLQAAQSNEKEVAQSTTIAKVAGSNSKLERTKRSNDNSTESQIMRNSDPKVKRSVSKDRFESRDMKSGVSENCIKVKVSVPKKKRSNSSPKFDMSVKNKDLKKITGREGIDNLKNINGEGKSLFDQTKLSERTKYESTIDETTKCCADTLDNLKETLEGFKQEVKQEKNKTVQKKTTKSLLILEECVGPTNKSSKSDREKSSNAKRCGGKAAARESDKRLGRYGRFRSGTTNFQAQTGSTEMKSVSNSNISIQSRKKSYSRTGELRSGIVSSVCKTETGLDSYKDSSKFIGKTEYEEYQLMEKIKHNPTSKQALPTTSQEQNTKSDKTVRSERVNQSMSDTILSQKNLSLSQQTAFHSAVDAVSFGPLVSLPKSRTLESESKDVVTSSISEYIRKLVFGESFGHTGDVAVEDNMVFTSHSSNTDLRKRLDQRQKVPQISLMSIIEESPFGSVMKSSEEITFTSEIESLKVTSTECFDVEWKADEDLKKQVTSSSITNELERTHTTLHNISSVPSSGNDGLRCSEPRLPNQNPHVHAEHSFNSKITKQEQKAKGNKTLRKRPSNKPHQRTPSMSLNGFKSRSSSFAGHTLGKPRFASSARSVSSSGLKITENPSKIDKSKNMAAICRTSLSKPGNIGKEKAKAQTSFGGYCSATGCTPKVPHVHTINKTLGKATPKDKKDETPSSGSVIPSAASYKCGVNEKKGVNTAKSTISQPRRCQIHDKSDLSKKVSVKGQNFFSTCGDSEQNNSINKLKEVSISGISSPTQLKSKCKGETNHPLFKKKRASMAIKKTASTMLDNYDIEVKKKEVLGAIVSLVTYKPKKENETKCQAENSFDHSENCTSVNLDELSDSTFISGHLLNSKQHTPREQPEEGFMKESGIEYRTISKMSRLPVTSSTSTGSSLDGTKPISCQGSAADNSLFDLDTDSESELTYTSKYGTYSLKLTESSITTEKCVDRFKATLDASDPCYKPLTFTLRPSPLDGVVKSMTNKMPIHHSPVSELQAACDIREVKNTAQVEGTEVGSGNNISTPLEIDLSTGETKRLINCATHSTAPSPTLKHVSGDSTTNTVVHHKPITDKGQEEIQVPAAVFQQQNSPRTAREAEDDSENENKLGSPFIGNDKSYAVKKAAVIYHRNSPSPVKSQVKISLSPRPKPGSLEAPIECSAKSHGISYSTSSNISNLQRIALFPNMAQAVLENNNESEVLKETQQNCPPTSNCTHLPQTNASSKSESHEYICQNMESIEDPHTSENWQKKSCKSMEAATSNKPMKDQKQSANAGEQSNFQDENVKESILAKIEPLGSDATDHVFQSDQRTSTPLLVVRNEIHSKETPPISKNLKKQKVLRDLSSKGGEQKSASNLYRDAGENKVVRKRPSLSSISQGQKSKRKSKNESTERESLYCVKSCQRSTANISDASNIIRQRKASAVSSSPVRLQELYRPMLELAASKSKDRKELCLPVNPKAKYNESSFTKLLNFAKQVEPIEQKQKRSVLQKLKIDRGTPLLQNSKVGVMSTPNRHEESRNVQGPTQEPVTGPQENLGKMQKNCCFQDHGSKKGSNTDVQDQANQKTLDGNPQDQSGQMDRTSNTGVQDKFNQPHHKAIDRSHGGHVVQTLPDAKPHCHFGQDEPFPNLQGQAVLNHSECICQGQGVINHSESSCQGQGVINHSECICQGQGVINHSESSCQGQTVMNHSEPSCQGQAIMKHSESSCQGQTVMNHSEPSCQGQAIMKHSESNCQGNLGQPQPAVLTTSREGQNSSHIFGSNASFTINTFQSACQPQTKSYGPSVKVSNYRLSGDNFCKYRQVGHSDEDE